MHYPWWYVPALTSPMLIALVAVFHVFVAQYAVGGGIILAREVSRAYRNDDTELLGYLHKHAWFFILVTVVYGAMTGVMIWWTIGLASPLATEALIHVFVFGWAIEWCAFIIEIIAAFLFFYAWGKISPALHVKLGWIYAWGAWVSLVLITGITAFMLNTANWPELGGFWRAFLNPQFVPQVLARTGGSVLLAALYVCLHAAFTLESGSELKAQVIRRAGSYTIPSVGLIALGGLGWFVFMPPSGRAIVEGTGAMNVFMGLTVTVTALVLGLMLYAPAKRPHQVTRATAIALWCLGLIAIGASEFLREAARKPYVIHNYVYGHGIYKDEVPTYRRDGLVRSSVWPEAYVRRSYPQLVADGGQVDMERAIDLPVPAQLDLGRMLFLYHCNDCHAYRGYSGVHGLILGQSPELIADLVRRPHRHHFFMPPWSGSEIEAELLTQYLLEHLPEPPIKHSIESGDDGPISRTWEGR